MEKTRYEEMREQCIDYHREHPEVWELFEKFTFQVINRGFKHYSCNAIFEQIRWETDTPDADGKSTFKINNNYRPFYARAFMRKYPRCEGFFRVREQTSNAAPATNLPQLGPDDFPYTEVRA